MNVARSRGNAFCGRFGTTRVSRALPKENAPGAGALTGFSAKLYGAAGPDPARIRCTTNKRIASPSRM